MFGSSPFSYAPGGLTPEDLTPRRSLHNDDQRASSVQKNNMTRPTGKSIYMQRKEYSEALNKQSDNLNVRVEHLFTCDIDGREVSSVSDCVTKLKRLDAKGRLWSQEMILELQGAYLLLCDIETKSELDSLSLSTITETNAVLDTCAYNSLLIITVQERNKHTPQVYMFQCEETGAEVIKGDLDKAIQEGGRGGDHLRDQSEIRINLENIIGHHMSGRYNTESPRAVLRDQMPLSPEPVAPQWSSREPDNYPSGETEYRDESYPSQFSQDPGPPLLSDSKRNTDIFNHVLNDLEIFMASVTAAINAASLQQGQKKKKPKKKNEPAVSLPTLDQYVSCLQKIKYGFNLLGELVGALTNPTAEDYVHIIFNILAVMVAQYPPHLPPQAFAPLLSEAALELLSSVVTPEEDELWGSLGESWTIPRSQWPEDNVPPYFPEFYDGWQPPPPSNMDRPISRSSSQRFPSRQQNGWDSSPRTGRANEPVYMQAIYDFMARNNRELSIMKGDVVEVVQKNKQWWLIRNNRNEEGHVPQNVLEPVDEPQREGPVTLDMSSTAAEVAAWLKYKGFSNMTVKSLGVLNGRQLLGMTKDELRTVCPEEGAKVLFQLQAIKTAIALASEPSGPYNGRY